MSKKTRERIIWTVFTLVILWILYRAACFLFVGLIPERRTFYLTYSSFLRDADHAARFMEELPESATRKKYFHRVFLFTYEDGYGTVISKDNYEDVKKQYLMEKEEYVDQFVNYITINGQRIEESEERKEEIRKNLNIYSVRETSQTEPDVAETLKQNHIEFFDRIAREDAEGGNYHFLWYWIKDDLGQYFEFMGVVYNDKTREIIEINRLKYDLSDW